MHDPFKAKGIPSMRQGTPFLSFWLCVCSIRRKGETYDLRLNLALETEASFLNQQNLAHIRQLAVARAERQHRLDPTTIETVVIENIMLLGRMAKEMFLAENQIGTEA